MNNALRNKSQKLYQELSHYGFSDDMSKLGARLVRELPDRTLVNLIPIDLNKIAIRKVIRHRIIQWRIAKRQGVTLDQFREKNDKTDLWNLVKASEILFHRIYPKYNPERLIYNNDITSQDIDDYYDRHLG